MPAPQKVLVTGATGQIGYMTFRALHAQPGRYDVYATDVREGPVRPRPRRVDARHPGRPLCPLRPGRFRRRGPPGRRASTSSSTSLRTRPAIRGTACCTTTSPQPTTSSRLRAQAGVQRIVAASSIMVSQGHREQEPYRAMWERRHADIPPDVQPVSPAVPAEPRSLYGASKVWTESLARVYADRHDISCICIRIGQVERDRPRPPQGADIYVSQRDIVQIFTRAVAAPPDLRFGVYYGMSDNDLRWVDIEGARRDLGYEPQDRAEAHHNYD